MGILDRLLGSFRTQHAYKKGQNAGRRFVEEIEESWTRLTASAAASRNNPAALKAMFIGWMQALHEQVRDFHRALGSPEGEYRQHWTPLAIRFADRFRTELLGLRDPSEAEQVLSSTEVEDLVADVDAVANDFRQATRAGMDAALDQAVQAVRAAEQAGRLSPDPRSDLELKEAIRAMWEEERQQERGH